MNESNFKVGGGLRWQQGGLASQAVEKSQRENPIPHKLEFILERI